MDSDSDYSDDELDRLNDTIFLHPENPFVKPYVNSRIIIYNGIPVIANDKIIKMPKHQIILARTIEHKACCIRWLLVFETILIIPYCYSDIGRYYFIGCALFTLAALCCCYNYSKRGIFMYICYVLTQLGLKITLLCYMIHALKHGQFYSDMEINDTVNAYYVITGQGLLICIDIPIVVYLTYYYTLLPTNNYYPDSIMI